MTTRAAIYCRISKDAAGLGLGVERQERESRQLCDRLGFEVAGEPYVDNDVSGYSGRRRPAYLALLDAMRSGGVDAVVCWHPDRITRSTRELEDLIDVLEETGVDIHTVTAGAYDLSTPAGRMQARIVGSVARYESEHKSARLRSKADQLALDGKAPGGRTPYGYDRVGDTYVINPAEAEMVRRVADDVLGGRSLLGIAKRLTAEGVPTREGRPWHSTTVRGMMVNPAVAGLRVHRREVAGPGNWPAILDRETWDRVRAVLADPARKKRRPAERYLLTGLVRSDAGDRMIGRVKADGRRTYVTPEPERGPHMTIDAERLELVVVEAVLQRFDGVRLTVPEPDRVGEEAAHIEAELEELARARGEGLITFREWMSAREPLLTRLEDARRLNPGRLPDVLQTGRVRDAWPTLDPDRRRSLLGAVLSGVIVRGAGGKGRWAKVEDRVELAYLA